MTATFNTNGGNTTLAFSYTATTAKIQAVAGDAVHELWDRGRGDHGSEESPIVWDDLTSQDKIDILDEYVKDIIVNMANHYKSQAAQEVARVSEAESEHTL